MQAHSTHGLHADCATCKQARSTYGLHADCATCKQAHSTYGLHADCATWTCQCTHPAVCSTVNVKPTDTSDVISEDKRHACRNSLPAGYRQRSAYVCLTTCRCTAQAFLKHITSFEETLSLSVTLYQQKPTICRNIPCRRGQHRKSAKCEVTFACSEPHNSIPRPRIPPVL